MMTIDADFIARYEEAEYRAQYKSAVADALRRIDRAREELIAAQNQLSETLGGANDYTRQAFADFYRAGGVTTRDWHLYAAGRFRSTTASRGQLRVVRASL